MRTHLLLATIASILVWGTVAASAQDDSDTDTQQLEQAQQDPGDEMVGQRLMRHSMGQGGMMRPFAMRIIFALMDRDGDGTISLEEFQAAHERIFKAMDADKDGTVSMDEMQDFIHGDREAGLPRRPGPRN